MNPERVQLFRIRYVIGRSKTRTGFENHLLSLPRGRLVPRQPRAFKSTTRTELTMLPYFKNRHNTHHHRIMKGFQKHNCYAITTWKTSHRATQHPCHCMITENPQNNLYPISWQSLLNHRVIWHTLQGKTSHFATLLHGIQQDFDNQWIIKILYSALKENAQGGVPFL